MFLVYFAPWLVDCDWKLAPLSRPIAASSLAFSRALGSFAVFTLSCSLALKGIWYRPLWLLWVRFYDIKSKSALVFGFVLHRVGDDFSKPFRGSYKTYIKKPYEEKLQNLSPWKHRKWINMSKCRLFYENNLIAFCKIKLFFNIWWLPATKTKYTIL